MKRLGGLFVYAVLLTAMISLFLTVGPFGLLVGIVAYIVLRKLWKVIAHILAIALGYTGKFCLKLGTFILHTAY